MKRIDIFLLLFTPALVFLLFLSVPEKTCPVPAGQARRIVSLSPSITRELVDQEGTRFLAGSIFSYCTLDKSIVDVGNFILPDWEKIARLRPDAVLMSQDDGILQAGEILSGLSIPCRVMRAPYRFEDLCEQYLELASITGNEKAASKRLTRYRSEYQRLCSIKPVSNDFRVAFMVSFEPLVAAGRRSHIGSVIGDAGAYNVYDTIVRPYSIVSMESLLAESPDLVIVMDYNYDDADPLSKNVTCKPEVPGAVIKIISTKTAPYVTPRDYLETLKSVISLLKEAERKQ